MVRLVFILQPQDFSRWEHHGYMQQHLELIIVMEELLGDNPLHISRMQ